MRSLMMKSCSGLAIAGALAMSPQAAQAQSFEGDSVVAHGTVTISEFPNSTFVEVDSPSAVIDWLPNDMAIGGGDILFQPIGTDTTFQGTSDFVVLNRIVPADTSRAIRFEGLVQSFIDADGPGPGMPVTGGTVFFYSPAGIVIGQNALFDVGNLGLTTAEPFVDPNGDWFINDQVTFQNANALTDVVVERGAVLQALEEDSFIALFAPFIRQQGDILVNGQAALVAGEAGSITFSPDGLFDIQVSVGTDAFGIENDGIVGGPQSSGPGDNHRVYMVAIPKATAISLAINGGSDIGFDVAGGAVNDGDAVILSAGFNVTGGDVDPVIAGGGGAADIDLNPVDVNTGMPAPVFFRSRTDMFANNLVNIDATAAVGFDADTQLFAADTVDVRIRDNGMGGGPGSIDVNGSLFVSSEDIGLNINGIDNGVAGIDVRDGGALLVAGDLIISARAGADSNGDGQATGSLAQLLVAGGSLGQIGGDLIIAGDSSPVQAMAQASANAGDANLFVLEAGTSLTVDGVTRLSANAEAEGAFNATAGTAFVSVEQGGVFTTGELNIMANARTSDGPGTATAGSAQITVDNDDSVLSVLRANQTGDAMAGELDFLSASAIGGTPFPQDNLDGGDAFAGIVNLRVNDGGVINLPGTQTSPLVINVNAAGGDATASNTAAGEVGGGNLTIDIINSAVDLGSFDIDVSVAGGSAAPGLTNAAGGNADGTATFLVFDGSTVTLAFTDYTNDVLGGDASSDLNGLAGRADGRTISLFSNASDVTFTEPVDLVSFVQGGMGGIGGPAMGSDISFTVTNGSMLDFSQGLLARTIARGGRGLATNSTIGANATGQFFNFFVADSTVSANGFIDLRAQLNGGNVEGSQGGSATGADIRVRLSDATILANTLSLNNFAAGGGSQGTFTVTDGGSGASGNAFVINEGGVVDIQANVTAISRALGGGAPQGGGNGADSFARAAVIDGTLGTSTTVTGNVLLISESDANPAFAGQGGDAFADGAQVISIGGDITINGTLRLDVMRRAGAGFVGGIGGSAQGSPFANIIAEGSNIIVTGPTTIDNIAEGGDAELGAGGSATGGQISVTARNAQGGSSITLNSLTANLTTTGGDGGDGAAGGNATGGLVEVLAQAQNAELTANSVTDIATATTGGNGGEGDNGGQGGLALGPNVNIGTISGGQFPEAQGFATFQNVNLVMNALGGAGGNGSNGQGGNGGEAFAGQADLIGRGASVTVADFFADATSIGGDGGSGNTQGNGGNALAGHVDLVFSNNLNGNTRGTLNARDIVITSDAVGGQGLDDGLAFGSGFGRILFTTADATIRDFSYTTNGIMGNATQQVAGLPTSTPNEIRLTDATVLVEDFTFTTQRDLTLVIDTAVLDTTTTNITVDDFLFEASPNGGGLIEAVQTITINSAQNILFDAGLDGDGIVTLTAGGDINIGAINSLSDVFANAQGLLSINQDWTAGALELVSSDIFLDPTAVLTAQNGAISLISLSPDGMEIGAGADTSTGYVVDDVMLGSLNATIINLITADAANGTILLDAIDLGITPNAEIINLTALGDGTIRVDDDVQWTSQVANRNLGVSAALVQINTDEGSLDVSDNGGTIFIEARQVHVGEPDTLDILLGDPTQEEVVQLLATPTAVQRDDGVLNAPNLTFIIEDNLFIQNTGTAELPAGFETTLAGSDVIVDTSNPDGVPVVINGQFDEVDGQLTGDAAANALFDFNPNNDPDRFADFADGSSINGCLFNGGCANAPDQPDVPDVAPPQEQVAATVNAEVQVVNEPPAVTTPANTENAADAAVTDAGLTGAAGNDAGGAMGEAQPGEIDSGSANDDFAFDDDPVITDSASGDNAAPTSSGSSEDGSESGPASSSPSEGEEGSAAEGEEPAEESSEDEATEEEETDATEEEEEEAEEAAASGPIMPPVSLFTTQALDNPVDVNDPVSSAGNPALLNPDVATPPAADTGDAQ